MTITVYHSENMRDTSFFGHEDIITETDILVMWSNGEYIRVAKVDTDDLDVAYELTNNIETSWVENDGVTEKPTKTAGMRSTSMGDIMVTEDGKIMIVAGHGFKELSI